MNLIEWSKRWNLPPLALIELNEMFGTDRNNAPVEMSESAVQQRIRLKESQKGNRLFRNNVGAFKAENGGMVRYGLANESKSMNKVLKSSDLIGITRVLITQEHVGEIMGVFTAYEVKEATWSYKGTNHEVAQWNFLSLISSLGGIARFITDAGDL